MRLGAPRLGNQGLEFAPRRSSRPQWRLTWDSLEAEVQDHRDAAVCPSQKHASICFCSTGIQQFGHALSEISLSVFHAKALNLWSLHSAASVPQHRNPCFCNAQQLVRMNTLQISTGISKMPWLHINNCPCHHQEAQGKEAPAKLGFMVERCQSLNKQVRTIWTFANAATPKFLQNLSLMLYSGWFQVVTWGEVKATRKVQTATTLKKLTVCPAWDLNHTQYAKVVPTTKFSAPSCFQQDLLSKHIYWIKPATQK